MIFGGGKREVAGEACHHLVAANFVTLYSTIIVTRRGMRVLPFKSVSR